MLSNIIPDCKICVLGPMNAGKSLLCKIAASQAVYPSPCYNATEESIVRIQQYTSTPQNSNQPVHVHLWDCSGSDVTAENKQAIFMGVDGVILVHNPSKQKHEHELEQLYKMMVQPLQLSKQQCAVVGMNLSGGVGISPGLTGKLAALKQHRIDVNLSNAQQAHGKMADAVDQLVSQCIAKQLLRAEEDVMAEV